MPNNLPFPIFARQNIRVTQRAFWDGGSPTTNPVLYLLPDSCVLFAHFSSPKVTLSSLQYWIWMSLGKQGWKCWSWRQKSCGSLFAIWDPDDIFLLPTLCAMSGVFCLDTSWWDSLHLLVLFIGSQIQADRKKEIGSIVKMVAETLICTLCSSNIALFQPKGSY